MPDFISKLQYKNYEKGEYSDEKVRSLEETITLVKNFPWEIERYADVELTGPSITILDPNGNYLKVGIYFGGRFSLYYLDTKHCFYEKQPVKIDVIYETITDFFSGQINLQHFEKHKFDYGTKSYLLSNTFEYSIKLWKVLLLSINWIIYFSIFFAVSVALNIIKPNEPFGIIAIIIMCLPGAMLVRIFWEYRLQKNQYLKISRGNDTFLFGNNKNEAKTYNKANISEIISYHTNARRSPNYFEIFEVVFKDESSIIFTNALISGYNLSTKFSDKWKFTKLNAEKRLFEIMRLIF